VSDADKFEIAERASRCAMEITQAIVDIEALGHKVAWSFGTITNDGHVGSPMVRESMCPLAGPATTTASSSSKNIIEALQRQTRLPSPASGGVQPASRVREFPSPVHSSHS
jgi:hypothetical protein